MAIQVSNVMKVIDLEAVSLSDEFKTWFSKSEDPTYKDQVLKEHLYDATFEERDIEEYPLKIQKEIKAIQQLARESEAAYFRIVYN